MTTQDSGAHTDSDSESTRIEWESIWSVPKFLILPYIIVFGCLFGFGAWWGVLPSVEAKECGWQDCLVAYAPVTSGLAITSAALAMLAVNFALVIIESIALLLLVAFELAYLVIRLLWDLLTFASSIATNLLKHTHNYLKQVQHGAIRTLQRMDRQQATGDQGQERGTTTSEEEH